MDASVSVYNASHGFSRNYAVEVFSHSSHGEDDEEELKWAALEHLPTYGRLRKALLFGPSGGDATEVDVKKLGFEQRKGLIDRLVCQDDNEEFLLKLKNRLDRVGIELPTIEVRFEHLNVETEAHVGSRALPSFTNFFFNIFEGLFTFFRLVPGRKRHISILRDVSGVLKPCRMTLLLGPPSSGKTTMLLALSGKLNPALKFSGAVTYNGHGIQEFIPQRTAAYISQIDAHIGEMTVRETLAFAARCLGVGSSHEMLAELVRREKESNIKPDHDVDVYMKAAAIKGQEESIVTDYMLRILGLDICADTLVGDQMSRGISGGQKKRVTTGEMLVGPAKVLFMDEISSGLDSSTTFQVVNSIRNYTHTLKGTTLMSLLQPEPETYNLFDDIILIADGQIVYQGPCENVLEFFESMGFCCPERKGVADFLQEVIVEKDQQQYWAWRDKPYRFVTVQEFAEAFRSFHAGQKLTAELATPFDKARSHPAALSNKKYGISKMELLKACISREFLLTKRNSFVHVFRLMQYIVTAIIAMTLFLRTTMHRNNANDGRKFLGALYYGISTTTFNGLVEIPLTIQKLPIFYKQRDMFFYPAWAYAIPKFLVKIPLGAVEIAVFGLLTYYEIGYDPNITRFFKYCLVLFLELQAAACVFRMVGAFCRNMISATTMALLAMILMLSLNGYVLSRVDVKKWWIWMYWLSPMMHASNALFVNEFTGHSWSHVSPGSNESLGIEVLKSRGFFTEDYWYWIGVGSMTGLILLCNLGFILALTFLGPLQRYQALVSKDTSENHNGIEKEDQSKKGMILPFEPHCIAFEDVTYSISMPQELKAQGAVEDRLVLLKGVTGAFRPGVLTALMGISGAGKTTLMDVLAGRKTGGRIDGNITISGHPKSQETFTRISGYCEQFDIHSPYVTVYESLLFSAWLRLPSEVAVDTRKMFVEKVMELVELTVLRGGIVGVPGVSGLSTEQRKRLTIAVELVANPSIIFMDEPTSGLDARAAAIVMRAVKNTVDTGRTVVCTIHQPSIDIFESFDELFLMKRGGQEIYVGPLGRHSCHLLQYFEAIQGVPKIKDRYNPATWMLEVTSSAQEMVLGVDFAELYRESDMYRKNKALTHELSNPQPGIKDLHFPTKYAQPWFHQCLACLWKQHWSYWRNASHTAVKLLYTIFLALIVGSIFWDLGSKNGTEQDILNAMGSMYASVFLLGIQSSSSVQPVLVVERPIFYRERGAGMYSALPYAFGQAFIEIPYTFVQVMIYGTIVYAMMGLEWTVAKYLWYIFFFFFTLLYFTYFGMTTVAISPNAPIASVISNGFFSMWSLFSGFLVPRPSTPVWWRWYHWVNPASWTMYGLLVSQFGDMAKELQGSNQSVQQFLRSYFGFKSDLIGIVAAAVVGFTVVFAFSYSALIKCMNFQKR